MLEHDNLEEYRDASSYDAINGTGEANLRFYSKLAHTTGGPILELACGTGRITIPMAEQGFEITGVDITSEMLERARQKAQNRGIRVEWLLDDARSLRLNRIYKFIYTTGNSFQAFLDRESQQAMLRTVYDHLHTDGIFAFETRNPILSHLCTGDGNKEEIWSFIDEHGICVNAIERRWYDHLTQIEHYVTSYHRIDESGQESTRINRISIRYVFPQDPNNPARTLYERFGYVHVGWSETSWIMKKTLD
jgi:ubiquinone/menaquinone biosynthesis C-methylase UbiE